MSDTLLQKYCRLDAELGQGGKVVLQVSLREMPYRQRYARPKKLDILSAAKNLLHTRQRPFTSFRVTPKFLGSRLGSDV